MSDKATVVIDADTIRIDAKTKKSVEGVKKLGQETAGAIRNSMDVASASIEKHQNKLLRTVVIAHTLARGLKTASDQMEKMRDNAAAKSESLGDMTISAAQSSVAMGLDPKAQQDFVNRSGAASPSEKVAFLREMASQNLGYSQEQQDKYNSALNSGLWSSSDVVNMAKNGEEPDIAKRKQELGGDAVAAIQLKAAADAGMAPGRGRQTPEGIAARFGKVQEAVDDAAHPGKLAAKNFITGLDPTGYFQAKFDQVYAEQAAETYGTAIKQAFIEGRKIDAANAKKLNTGMMQDK